MKKWFLILLLGIPLIVSGQDVLDEYIKYGLENNLALQQKQADYRKSLEMLKEARGLFYPNISLNARYSVADGGRIIEFPVGDMLNPVYSTLNKLTASNSFPQIENMSFRFLRPTEQETHLRLFQPLINTDIYFNSKIRNELVTFQDEDVNQYRRELVAEIRKAYYNAATADGVLKMLLETRKLLVENIRVSRKLIENDKVTMDYLYRSEAELAKFDQELQNAGKNRTVAAAYFNFLINKPLSDTIVLATPDTFPSLAALNDDFSGNALTNREELKKLEAYKNASDYKVKMEQSGKLPELFVAVDYGIQGTSYQFNRESDYVLASAVLSWNLFSGFQNKAKIRQAQADNQIIDAKLAEARQQIELQVVSSLNELYASEKGISAAESRLRNASEAFRLVNRKFEEGQANLLEFIDARTTLTQAEENLIVSRFSYLSCYAEFEKVTAINKEYR
jgi:outer membrane protein TolC